MRIPHGISSCVAHPSDFRVIPRKGEVEWRSMCGNSSVLAPSWSPIARGFGCVLVSLLPLACSPAGQLSRSRVEFFVNQGSSDPHRLDADNDGMACEDRPSGSDSSSPVAVPNEDGGGSDQGAMPSGGIEAGHGGMAENASDSVGQWSLAVGALLTASGVVVLRRRRVGGTG